MIKDAKIDRSRSGKACSREKTKDVFRMSRASSHAKALKTQSDSDPHNLTREPLGSQGVIPQPPQQKPKVDMGLPGK